MRIVIFTFYFFRDGYGPVFSFRGEGGGVIDRPKEKGPGHFLDYYVSLCTSNNFADRIRSTVVSY